MDEYDPAARSIEWVYCYVNALEACLSPASIDIAVDVANARWLDGLVKRMEGPVRAYNDTVESEARAVARAVQAAHIKMEEFARRLEGIAERVKVEDPDV